MLSNDRAQTPVPLAFDWSRQRQPLVSADWSAYAVAYDLLAKHNPAYQALLADFDDFLATIEPPRLIYDIGGGTGNYTEIAARKFPNSEIHFIEPDPGMVGLAQAKLADLGNIIFDNSSFEDVEASSAADLVICVHALYAMPAQGQRLVQLSQLLRPQGWLYLIDLGRPMNVSEWRRYLFSHLKEEYGLAGALRIFWEGREIARQNKNILSAQISGHYWTHTPADFASAARASGLEVVTQKTVYRGYSDLLVCRSGDST